MKNTTRMTSQRIKILDYLRSVKTHPTAEMVHKEVLKSLPAITLATVYRNLNLLAEQGVILRLEVNKEYRYDGDSCCHHHLICRKCEKIIDIEDSSLTGSALKTIDRKIFDPDSVRIMFYGICADCKKGA